MRLASHFRVSHCISSRENVINHVNRSSSGLIIWYIARLICVALSDLRDVVRWLYELDLAS